MDRKKTWIRSPAVLFILSCILYSGDGRTAIIYDDFVDGDLSGSAESPTGIGTIGPGDNTIRGLNFGTADVDIYSFDIAAGTAVEGLNFRLGFPANTFQPVSGNLGLFQGVDALGTPLADVSFSCIAGACLFGSPPVLVNNVDLLELFSLDPLGAGSYTIHLGLRWTLRTNPATWIYDFSVAETVPEIPLPATIWLFGTALFGLAGLGRLKQAA